MLVGRVKVKIIQDIGRPGAISTKHNVHVTYNSRKKTVGQDSPSTPRNGGGERVVIRSFRWDEL